MKTLFDAAEAEAVKARIAHLTPDSPRQWGKMGVGQMIAHCAIATEMAVGEHNPPRMVLGRVVGKLIKPLVLKENKPMQRNAPTAPSLVIYGDPDLEREKARLSGLIERFAQAGKAGCTKHPHPFFGALTPDEWGALVYKHTDHHLRQFGL